MIDDDLVKEYFNLESWKDLDWTPDPEFDAWMSEQISFAERKKHLMLAVDAWGTSMYLTDNSYLRQMFETIILQYVKLTWKKATEIERAKHQGEISS